MKKRKHKIWLLLVVLCLIFLSGETLVVYATEDGLTNEVNEANENRFSEKKMWE